MGWAHFCRGKLEIKAFGAHLSGCSWAPDRFFQVPNAWVWDTSYHMLSKLSLVKGSYLPFKTHVARSCSCARKCVCLSCFAWSVCVCVLLSVSFEKVSTLSSFCIFFQSLFNLGHCGPFRRLKFAPRLFLTLLLTNDISKLRSGTCSFHQACRA